MDKTYMASLCYGGGLLGGALVLEDERVGYHSTKLQVPPDTRNFFLPFCRIRGVEKSRALFLPTVTIKMEDGGERKFLVFGRRSFLENLKTAMDAYASGE